MTKEQLKDTRVVQKDLVYVIGIPPRLAADAVLRKQEYFGQYGKVVDCTLNKAGGGNASAYVTYAREADAKAAIIAADGAVVDGRTLRCSYGTTKYCHAWLRDSPCTTSGCLYLHVSESKSTSSQ